MLSANRTQFGKRMPETGFDIESLSDVETTVATGNNHAAVAQANGTVGIPKKRKYNEYARCSE
jgi:hypothetical protein